MEYVLGEAKATCFRQFLACLVTVIGFSWIAEASYGPAAEIFRVVSGILLFALLGTGISLYSHFKWAKIVRRRFMEEIRYGTEAEKFWYMYRDVFPIAWK
ncbi:hypothetical protein [Celeribacter sp. SCSIO 80788]|uniref:hypothetical protein n=1 Tax=Celeribacter sp. SCSIO 80788 TaxID=3117013 RepID=UPI003DA47E7A